MGALHDGHFSLVEKSIDTTDKTITTLFLNPKQFAANEDLAIYPRDEIGDADALETRGVDLLFAPSVEEVYSVDFSTEISVPGIGDVLEGAFRPGFFTGVATVVAKLLIQTLPDRVFFGEKDIQQIYVIKRMVTDLNIPVEIVGCPTIREPDGLALSSRNTYLSRSERTKAVALYNILNEISNSVIKGETVNGTVEEAKIKLLNAGFSKVDYLTVYGSYNFIELNKLNYPAYVLGAAWIGKTRLIDNIKIS
jgi:pantoate--beta-alanine ligase